MQPTALKLKNFKSIGPEQQVIPLAPITLLFGPNSAGKSTVLQALIYLREIIKSGNLDPDRTAIGGDFLDLGGFRNLVHGRDSRSSIEIECEFDLGSEVLPDYLTTHENLILENQGLPLPEEWLNSALRSSVGITLSWSEIQNRPYVQAYSVTVNGEHFVRIVSTPDNKQVYIENLNLQHPIMLDGPSLLADEEEDVFPSGFSAAFSSLVNPSVLAQASRGLDDVFKGDRPLAAYSIDELEELVKGTGQGREMVLGKVQDELRRRTSRRANQLAKRVDLILSEAAPSQSEIQYIGLYAQKDALPDVVTGLKLDPDAWLSEMELGEYEPSAVRLLIESVLNGLVVGPLKILWGWLDTFSYIGPLRDLPPRNLAPQKTPDIARWAKGLAAWELFYDASIEYIDEINYWLGEECLDTGYQVIVHNYRELPVHAEFLQYLNQEMEFDQQLVLKDLIEALPVKKRVALREQQSGLEVQPQDIGVGISQLIPVVALSIYQQSGLISIEQPELHVHPAIQVELADLFARYALKHNKVFLLETHSEHLILRLLRRIREKKEMDAAQDRQMLDKQHVSVVYVEPATEGTLFKCLRIDETGDFIDEWPNGFFEERDEELFF